MTHTRRHGLTYLQANQAQKHVSLNEALKRVDTLIRLAVLSAVCAGQPPAPAAGDVYLFPTGATGAQWSSVGAELARLCS